MIECSAVDSASRFTASMAACIWSSVHTFLLEDRLVGVRRTAGAELDRFLLVRRFLCPLRGMAAPRKTRILQ